MKNSISKNAKQEMEQKVKAFLGHFYGTKLPENNIPSKEQEEKVFSDYYRTKSQRIRDAIIERYLYAVGEIAFTVYVRSWQDAALLISEANAELVRILESETIRFDPSKARFKTFLFLRIRAALYNFCRVERVVSGTKNKKSPEVCSLDVPETELHLADFVCEADTGLVDRELWVSFLEELLQTLSQRDREVATLLFIKNTSAREVAGLYEVSHQSVYDWKHRLLGIMYSTAKSNPLFNEWKDREEGPVLA